MHSIESNGTFWKLLDANCKTKTVELKWRDRQAGLQTHILTIQQIKLIRMGSKGKEENKNHDNMQFNLQKSSSVVKYRPKQVDGRVRG